VIWWLQLHYLAPAAAVTVCLAMLFLRRLFVASPILAAAVVILFVVNSIMSIATGQNPGMQGKRMKIAQAFNNAVREGKIGPVVLGRDHHDVSGTDSPYRETSNIYDGSRFTADMAIHNVIGDSFRGATWVSIHNGGGVGWGEVMNGGFGMLLDGSADADRKLKNMLHFDVNNGIARRAWARNDNALLAIKREMDSTKNLYVTLPNAVNDSILDRL
jgi:urocanate hydratase